MPIPELFSKITEKFKDLKETIILNSPRKLKPELIKEESTSLFSKILSIIKVLIKIGLVFVIIVLNSFIYCYIVNSIFRPYNEIVFPFNFYFSETNQVNLMSEISTQCNKFKKRRGNIGHCLNNLEKANYDIFVELEIANRGEVFEDKNYELELDIHTIDGEMGKFKKMFFFDQGTFSDYLSKINFAPTKMLGFYNKKDNLIKIIDDYPNKDYDLITKIDVIFKSRNINIFKSNLIFKPKNGIIRRIYSRFRFIILIVSFWVCYAWQIAFCIILLLIKTFVLSKKKDDKKED